MKYFLFLYPLLFSVSALTNEGFQGLWAWSGNQCRNQAMDLNSARSVEGDVSGFNIDFIRATLESTGKVTFQYAVEGGAKRTETGLYKTVDGNQVYIVGSGNEVLNFRLIEDQLVNYQDNSSLCQAGEKFVRIFGKINGT